VSLIPMQRKISGKDQDTQAAATETPESQDGQLRRMSIDTISRPRDINEGEEGHLNRDKEVQTAVKVLAQPEKRWRWLKLRPRGDMRRGTMSRPPPRMRRPEVVLT